VNPSWRLEAWAAGNDYDADGNLGAWIVADQKEGYAIVLPFLSEGERGRTVPHTLAPSELAGLAAAFLGSWAALEGPRAGIDRAMIDGVMAALERAAENPS
jgi:hypothetical protein